MPTSIWAQRGHGERVNGVLGATGLDSRNAREKAEMTDSERDAVVARGQAFTGGLKGDFEPAKTCAWLLISGQFGSYNHSSTEDDVKRHLQAVFGYPDDGKPRYTINVLVDSVGGSLDSAYKTALYISRYAKQFNLHIPRKAKSASTLLALVADRIFLSPFAELGPLDTQIDDPRNPTYTVSALDCYQSVDYVRHFGFRTMGDVLAQLVAQTEGRVSLNDLLGVSSQFAIGAISPMLQSVKALDFGGWGRSLKIGEKYAQKLLIAKDPDEARAFRIAERLVYGYTHHPFPIDYVEAQDIGLEPEYMVKSVYAGAKDVIEACHDKNFVGFISEEHAKREAGAQRTEKVERERQPDAESSDGSAKLPRRPPASSRAQVGKARPEL